MNGTGCADLDAGPDPWRASNLLLGTNHHIDEVISEITQYSYKTSEGAHMAYALDNNGFPPGYFVVRSIACNRLLDIDSDSSEDGADVILYPESESSLVESAQGLVHHHTQF